MPATATQQARNQLGTPGGAKRNYVQYFKRCPTHFSRGGEKFSKECFVTPPPSWLRAYYSVAKSHKDRNGSQSEYLWTLVTFWGGATVSSNQRRHVVWQTVSSQCFQVPRVANFATSLSFFNCVTMDGNLANVHISVAEMNMDLDLDITPADV